MLAATIFADQTNRLAETNDQLGKQKVAAESATVAAKKAQEFAENLAGELKKTNESLKVEKAKAFEATKTAIVALGKAEDQRLAAEKQTKIADEQRKIAEIARDDQAGTNALNTTLLAKSRWNEGQVILANDMLEQVPDKFRYGGWHVLRRQLEGSYTTLYGHLDAVKGAAFSPDGNLIAANAADGKLKVWDAHTGKNKYTLDGAGVFAFSPDSQRLAIGANRALHLFDFRVGKVTHTRDKLHTEDITSVAFSPDGSRLVSGSQDGAIQSCDAATLDKPTLLKKAHVSGVMAIAFSPDGKQFASTGLDKALIIWDTAKNELVQMFPRVTNGIGGVAYSPDSKLIAFVNIVLTPKGDAYQLLKAWKTDALGTDLSHIQGRHGSDIAHVTISPDGRQLATAGFDGVIKLWDVATGKELQWRRPFEGRSVHFSPDGCCLFRGRRSHRRLGPRVGQELQPSSNSPSRRCRSARSTINLAAGSLNGVVKVWNAVTGKDV